MKSTIYKGCATAVVTPMNSDLSVNYEAFAALIDEQIAGGISALVVCGTTGEASTLSTDEHIEVIRFACEKCKGKIPVIAGTGSNDTAYMLELSRAAENAGADALLLMTPYYNKTSQRGIVANFHAVADAVNIPIMLYNIPPRTCVNIELPTFVELAKHPRIVAVKEAGGDINYMAQIIAACPDLDVYSGDDALTVPAMSLGAKGVVSVAGNVIPKVMSEMCKLCLDNDFAAAGEINIRYLKLFADLLKLDVNPVPVKTALNLMGKGMGGCRMPLYEMDTDGVKALFTRLEESGIISK
jgi:4-hydroxy-tetrahydrodipicolinate synthase